FERQGREGALTRFGAFGQAAAVQLLQITGRCDRARALVRGLEGIEDTRPGPEPAALGWIYWARMSEAFFLDADEALALELAEGSIASFLEAGDPQGLMFAVGYQGRCLTLLGAFERAEQVL